MVKGGLLAFMSSRKPALAPKMLCAAAGLNHRALERENNHSIVIHNAVKESGIRVNSTCITCADAILVLWARARSTITDLWSCGHNQIANKVSGQKKQNNSRKT